MENAGKASIHLREKFFGLYGFTGYLRNFSLGEYVNAFTQHRLKSTGEFSITGTIVLYAKKYQDKADIP